MIDGQFLGNFCVSDSAYLEFSLINYVHELCWFVFFVDYLLSNIVAFHKRQNHFFELVSCPVFEIRKVFEKFCLCILFSSLDLFNDALIVITSNNSKTAVRGSLNSCRTRFVVDQSKFSETLAFRQSNNFNEPLQIVINVEKKESIDVSGTQDQVLFEIKIV